MKEDEKWMDEMPAEENEVSLKEQKRHFKKEMKHIELAGDSDYRLIASIAKYMDKFYIDPIVGFLFPAVGDIFTSVMTLPYLTVSALKIKSLPLTLAVIYNMLMDMLIGSIPFFIGDICDVFHRSYTKNYQLIVGFVEDDPNIVRAVNEKAWKTGAIIVILCLLIYLVTSLLLTAVSSVWEFLANLFS